MKEKHYFMTSYAFAGCPIKETATPESITREFELWAEYCADVGKENAGEPPVWKARSTAPRNPDEPWSERYAYIPVESGKTLYTPTGVKYKFYHWERVLITIIDSTRHEVA